MRTRRGVEAIEFALVVPVLLALMSGTFDYGWYFHQQMVLTDATRIAARAAAVTPQSGDPIQASRAALTLALTGSDQLGINPQVDVKLVTMANGEQAVQVTTQAPYTGLWGLVSLPYQLQGNVVMRREEQPAEP